MLKKIPTAISPELMKVLMEDGARRGNHDFLMELPSRKIQTARPIVVRMDGMRVQEILEAVCSLCPWMTMYPSR